MATNITQREKADTICLLLELQNTFYEVFLAKSLT